jgi:hypothetical protein
VYSPGSCYLEARCELTVTKFLLRYFYTCLASHISPVSAPISSHDASEFYFLATNIKLRIANVDRMYMYEGRLKSSWIHHSESELCGGGVTVCF